MRMILYILICIVRKSSVLREMILSGEYIVEGMVCEVFYVLRRLECMDLIVFLSFYLEVE